MNQIANCPELNTLQIWVGYLSWLGFLKGLGAALIAAGIIFVTYGVIKDFVLKTKYLLEISLAYVVTFSAHCGRHVCGPRIPGGDRHFWAAFSLRRPMFLTIFLHKLKGADPKPLATLFMVAVGCHRHLLVTLSRRSAFSSVLALMSLLGFSVVVASFVLWVRLARRSRHS